MLRRIFRFCEIAEFGTFGEIKMLKVLSFILIMIFTHACSKGDFRFHVPATGLGGEVSPLKTTSFLSTALTSISCDDQIYARLYALKPDGSLEGNSLISTEVINGRYSFQRNQLPSLSSTKVQFQVMIEGCDLYLARPVTGYNQKQHVTYESSLIGSSTSSSLNKGLTQIETSEIQDLIQSIQGAAPVRNVYIPRGHEQYQ